MENTKLDKGIEDVRAITMTADEKDRIREYIISSPVVVKQKSIYHPYMISLYIMKSFQKFSLVKVRRQKK
jgi:hypothetical protein